MKFTNAALTVIKAVLDAPDDQEFGGRIGTGGHARSFTVENRLFAKDGAPVHTSDKFHKAIIPGDNKHTVIVQLQYLLGDLAVDLDLPDEIRDALYGVEK